MSNLFAKALPKETKEPEFPKSSRIDVIGQNGNDGLHYEPTHFAIQTMFAYGWDYIGYDDKDGLREVFKTEAKAKKEMKEIIEFTQTDPKEWRVVSYNPHEDDTFKRLP